MYSKLNQWRYFKTADQNLCTHARTIGISPHSNEKSEHQQYSWQHENTELTAMFSILHDNADKEKTQKEIYSIKAQICFT